MGAHEPRASEAGEATQGMAEDADGKRDETLACMHAAREMKETTSMTMRQRLMHGKSEE